MSTHQGTSHRVVETHGPGVTARTGLWLFLLSEILLFGGMFILYSMYRYRFHADFHAGSMELSRFDGTLNTAILLTSSLTAVIAIFSLQELNKPRRTMFFLAATIAFGFGFLINPTAYDSGRSAGSLAWAGLNNTFYWIDPKRSLCAVIMMQFLPFVDKEALGLLGDYEHAVYSSLNA